MRKSDRNVIVRHHNNDKNSVYRGKLLPACLPAFFYCCKTTKINHQADQKQNTRIANSVTGPVSTSVGIGDSLRKEIFRLFHAAVKVTWTSPFPKP